MSFRIPLFAYGLYMDVDVLRSADVDPHNPRIGVVHGYDIALGEKSTMIPTQDASVWGVAVMLTHAEIDTLYAPFKGLYQPEAMLMHLSGGALLPTVGYIIKPIPENQTVNTDYARKLHALVQKLGFDAEYVQRIEQMFS